MKFNKIALIGMMGSGKSSIAHQLAKKLNFDLFELDEIFENENNIKIKEYFEKFGEEKFRNKESEILKNALKNDCSILSCGGGIILKEENRKLLFNKEVLTVYLCATCDTLYNRLKKDTTRPLLQVENPKYELEKILLSREEFYKLANLAIETDNKTKEEITEEILGKIWKE